MADIANIQLLLLYELGCEICQLDIADNDHFLWDSNFIGKNTIPEKEKASIGIGTNCKPRGIILFQIF